MGTLQGIEIVLLCVGVIVVIAHVVTQYLREADLSHPMARVALGVIPGLIGVGLAVVSRLDVIPDDMETPLWAAVVIGITAVAVLGTSYRLVRR